MHSHQPRGLSVASLTCLLAAVALGAPVAERVVAATWQWSKFASHTGGGHISLSFGTGLIFSSLLAFVFVAALVVNRIAARQSSARAASALSRWALGVIVVTATTYWLLGASSFNVWRA